MNLEAPRAAEGWLGLQEKGFSFARALRSLFPPPGGVRFLSQLQAAVIPNALFISAGAGRWPRATGQDGAVQLSHPTQRVGLGFHSCPLSWTC